MLNKKVSHIIGSYLSFVVLFLLWLGLYFKGFWFLSGAVFMVILVPIVDSILPLDTAFFEAKEFTSNEVRILKASPALYVLLHVITIYLYLPILNSLTVGEEVMAAISLGLGSGIAISACHELIHCKAKSLRHTVGKLGLLNFFYMFFEYSHVFGHHKNVATSADNNTAWAGESVYHYVCRTIKGTFKYSWEYEKRRLEESNLSIINNRVISGLFLSVTVLICIYALLGVNAAVFFIVQAVIGVLILEMVSYIEHYSLVRSKNGEGYSRISIYHSWDAYHRFSNYLLFGLPRHADHHMNPNRHYYLLRTNSDTPQLPLCYPLMLTICALPFLFKLAMGGKNE